MERHLHSREFFVAARYTVADIALYAYTHGSGKAAVQAISKRTTGVEPATFGLGSRRSTN